MTALDSGWAAESPETYDLDENSRAEGWLARPGVVTASLDTGKPWPSIPSRRFRHCLAELKVAPRGRGARWVWLVAHQAGRPLEDDDPISAVLRAFDGPACLAHALIERQFRENVSLELARGKLGTILRLSKFTGPTVFFIEAKGDQIPSRLPEWLLNFYNEPRDKATRSSLRIAVREINSLLRARELGRINEVLAQADFGRLAPDIIMAILRSTVSTREYYADWNSSLERAYDELKDRGLDPDQILVGLLDL